MSDGESFCVHNEKCMHDGWQNSDNYTEGCYGCISDLQGSFQECIGVTYWFLFSLWSYGSYKAYLSFEAASLKEWDSWAPVHLWQNPSVMVWFILANSVLFCAGRYDNDILTHFMLEGNGLAVIFHLFWTQTPAKEERKGEKVLLSTWRAHSIPMIKDCDANVTG